MVKTRWLGFALVAAIIVAACSDNGDSGPSTSTNGCFVAFEAQFQGFRGWASNHFTSATDVGSSHTSGPRTEYWNEAPPSGASTFPVGTVIVKEIQSPDPTQYHLFAMAKRGCDFDSDGAKNWEWFELTETSGAVSIKWRGVGPPAGEQYGTNNGGCNTCHATACVSNDSVCSPTKQLQLSP